MKSQTLLLREKSWDCIFLLDACRYDVFEKIYGDYLDGELQKVKSPGSATKCWAMKTFEDGYFQDVVYISGNPFVNSEFPIGALDLREKFDKIIDVWNFGWNSELGTVPPEAVIEAGRGIGKKKILHFLQPHAPYPGKVKGISLTSITSPKPSSFVAHLQTLTGRRFSDLIWKTLLKLGAKYLILKDGIKSVLKGYKENLQLVLKEISKHLDKFKGKLIVTSDHGEAFGEDGIYEHPPNQSCPVLREVPWLEITK